MLAQEAPQRDLSLLRLHMAGISITDGRYDPTILERVPPENRERTAGLLLGLTRTSAGMVLDGIKSGKIGGQCLDSLYPATGILNNISGEQCQEAIRLITRIGGDRMTLEALGNGLKNGYFILSDLREKSPEFLRILAQLANEDFSTNQKDRIGPQGFNLVLNEENRITIAVELATIGELHGLLIGKKPAELILYGIALNNHRSGTRLEKETFKILCTSSRSGLLSLEQVHTIARSIATGSITNNALSRLLRNPASFSKPDMERIFLLLQLGREEDIRKVVDSLETGDITQVKRKTEELVTDELVKKHANRFSRFLENFDPERRIPLAQNRPNEIAKDTKQWLQAFCERDYDRALSIAKSENPLYRVEYKSFIIELADLRNESRLKECVTAIYHHGSADLKEGEKVATLTRLLVRLPNGELIDISKPEIGSETGRETDATKAFIDSFKSDHVIRKLRGLLAHQAWEECLVHMKQPERGVLSPTGKKFLYLARANKSHEYFKGLPDQEGKFNLAMREIDVAAFLIDAGMTPADAKALLADNHPVREGFFKWVSAEIELRKRHIRTRHDLLASITDPQSRKQFESHLSLAPSHVETRASAAVVSPDRPPGQLKRPGPLKTEIASKPYNSPAPKGKSSESTGHRVTPEKFGKARGGAASALVLFGPLIEEWLRQNDNSP
ncbi:MAG: hypothetical protein KC777_10405 [Cyanobacteria bacterium HKST-UBA02]|nr:hypothetical protein [Cyanobacteria bacterium HKST-UBA02]